MANPAASEAGPEGAGGTSPAPVDYIERLKVDAKHRGLWDAISMKLSFGERPTEFHQTLFRLLMSDRPLAAVFRGLMALRGIKNEEGVRDRLGVTLFKKKKGTGDTGAMPKYACLGTLLHLARGWKGLDFPAGTLFEQREVGAAIGEDAPKLARVTDSSQTLGSPLKDVAQAGTVDKFFHVASVHRRALLSPVEEDFLREIPVDELSLELVKSLAVTSCSNVTQDAIVATLRDLFLGTSTMNTYWDSHADEYPESPYIQKKFSHYAVATFRGYCNALLAIGKGVWGIQNHLWAPEDEWEALTKVIEDAKKGAEAQEPGKGRDRVEGEIYAAMKTAAVYVKSAGVLADAYYHGGIPGIWMPGQHNLLGIAHYWVTHASDAVSPGDANTDMRRYLDVVYDFFNWAGSVGLFGFFLPGTIAPAITLPDLEKIAKAEGLSANLKKDSNIFTENPRMHAQWPYPIRITHKGVIKTQSGQHAMKVILYHRLQRVFGLLKKDSYVTIGKQGVNALVRAAAKKLNSGGSIPTGFEWIRLDQEKGGAPGKGKGKGMSAKMYLQRYANTSYRYILNYVGGLLSFFPQYVDGELGAQTKDWKHSGPLEHPLDRWRYYLEITYMITLNTQATAAEAMKRPAKIIKDILPILVGTDVNEDIKKAVDTVTPPKGIEKVRTDDYDALIDTIFENLVTDAGRGKLEDSTPATAPDTAATTSSPMPPSQVTTADYYRELAKKLRPFIIRHLARIRTLRHFYRSHYFYYDPAVVDYVHPSYLEKNVTDEQFKALLLQEVEARQAIANEITGGMRRVRVYPPNEIGKLLSRVVLGGDGNPLIQDQAFVVSDIEFPKLMAGLQKDDREGRIICRFYEENGAEIQYAINEHAWHTLQHEVNQRLGWHVWNWEAFATRIAHYKINKEEIPSPFGVGKDAVVNDVTAVAEDQQSKVARSSDILVNTTRALLEEVPKSFPILAGFAFANRLPKEFLKALKEKENGKKKKKNGEGWSLAGVSDGELRSHARMVRNLFDHATDVTPKDSFEWTFPHVLGQKLNRARLGTRLDAFYKKFTKEKPSTEGTDEDDQEDPLAAIFGWGRARRFLLHLCDEKYIFDDQRRPLLAVFSNTWGIDNVEEALQSVPGEAKTYAGRFLEHYPHFDINTFPVAGRTFKTTEDIIQAAVQGKKSQESGTGDGQEPEKSKGKLTRDEILLAVMKALALTYEQEEKAAKHKKKKKNGQLGTKSRVSNLKSKLLKMIYAHEALLGVMDEELTGNELSPLGLRCLIDVPAMLPSQALARTLGWVVSEIVRNPFVTDRSLAAVKIADQIPEIVNRGIVEEDGDGQSEEGEDEEPEPLKGPWTLKKAESFRTKSFTADRKNFGDAVEDVLSILATGQAFGADTQKWETFADDVAKAWEERQKQVIAGEWNTLNISNLFKSLLDPAQESFAKFAQDLKENIEKLKKGEIRSLYQDSGKEPKAKPLPLWLSNDKQTLGYIPPFGDIERYLAAGAVIPLRKIMAVPKEDPAWEWKVNTGSKKTQKLEKLSTVFPPGVIPFCIESPPLTEDDVKSPKVRKFFGHPAGDPIHPEIRVAPRVVEKDERHKKTQEELEAWQNRYEKSGRKVQRKIASVLDQMYAMRQFELDIKRRLIRRRSMIVTLIKLGRDANAIEKEFASVRPPESWFSPLTEEEGDAIDAFLGHWEAGKDKPDQIVEWLKKREIAKVIQQDDPDVPGKRVDAFLTQEKANELADLVGLPHDQIRTWEGSTSITPGKRATQLIALLGFHLTRLGFDLRGLRARREFYQKAIQRLDVEINEIKAKKKKGPVDHRPLRMKILAKLEEHPIFGAFTRGTLVPCGIKVAKGVPVAKENTSGNGDKNDKDGKNGNGGKNGGHGKDEVTYDLRGRLLGRLIKRGTIGGIQIQVPKYPSMAVAANVWLRAKPSPPAYSRAWDAEFGRKLDMDRFFCIDINRLDCARTITPAGVQNKDGVPDDLEGDDDIASWKLSLDNWAKLAGVFNFRTNAAHTYTGRDKRGKTPDTKDVYTTKEFQEKVLSAAFTRRGDKWYRAEPTETFPYDIDDPDGLREIDFLDEVGALMKYWGHKHAHLERKKPAIIRQMTKCWTVDRNNPKWRHWLRLRTELYFLNRRGKTIRDAILQYLFRVGQYCQARLKAKYIAHENLGLNPSGEGEGLGRVVSSMMKDFKPVERALARQFRAQGRMGGEMPRPKAVGAWYTSQKCNWCDRHGVKGMLDDHGSSEWAICDTCGKIYDRHKNGATNVGDRAVRSVYSKKKRDKTKEGK